MKCDPNCIIQTSLSVLIYLLIILYSCYAMVLLYLCMILCVNYIVLIYEWRHSHTQWVWILPVGLDMKTPWTVRNANIMYSTSNHRIIRKICYPISSLNPSGKYIICLTGPSASEANGILPNRTTWNFVLYYGELDCYCELYKINLSLEITVSLILRFWKLT